MVSTALPRLQSATGRWIVLATVLGSAVASLDATVVNVALPEIGRALDSDVAGLQWILSGYTLTLASFILLGGALGDRLGRRRVFVWGTAGFAATSLICGLANNVETLIAARIAQGVAAALLTPGSLALIAASIDDRDQGAAIGLWSGLGGVAGAVGPLVGGWLIEIASWRAVFLVNLPLAAAVVWVAARHVPESRDPDASARLDLPGAVVVALGLGALTFGLITPAPVAAIAGVALLGVFAVIEIRTDHPLVPPSLFASRVFTAANLVTLAAYAALGGVFFLLLLQLQIVSGYSPLSAGVATIPITLLMLALSSRAGKWAQKHGPRIPMTVGPLLAAAGVAMMTRIGSTANYLTDVLPAVIVFGLGLSALVAPLTGAVLGSVPTAESGIASGVNNAVARTAQLLAVAALPGIAGISAAGFDDPVAFDAGFRVAMTICAGLLVLSAALAALLLRTGPTTRPGAPETGEPETAELETAEPATAAPETVDCLPHCAVTGPAVQPTSNRTGAS